MDGDLLLLIFAYIQPSLWQEEWIILNLLKSCSAILSRWKWYLWLLLACDVEGYQKLYVLDFLWIFSCYLWKYFFPGYCRFPGKAALLFQKSSSLAAACLSAKTLSYWSEDLTVPNPSKTSYGRPCLLWGADLGRHVPLLHAALSRSFSMEEAPSWDSSQDSTRLGKTR